MSVGSRKNNEKFLTKLSCLMQCIVIPGGLMHMFGQSTGNC